MISLQKINTTTLLKQLESPGEREDTNPASSITISSCCPHLEGDFLNWSTSVIHGNSVFLIVWTESCVIKLDSCVEGNWKL